MFGNCAKASYGRGAGYAVRCNDLFPSYSPSSCGKPAAAASSTPSYSSSSSRSSSSSSSSSSYSSSSSSSSSYSSSSYGSSSSTGSSSTGSGSSITFGGDSMSSSASTAAPAPVYKTVMVPQTTTITVSVLIDTFDIGYSVVSGISGWV